MKQSAELRKAQAPSYTFYVVDSAILAQQNVLTLLAGIFAEWDTKYQLVFSYRNLVGRKEWLFWRVKNGYRKSI